MAWSWLGRGQEGGVPAIGGSEIPGRDTFRPGSVTFPPMIVGPMATLIGPTFGGTDERSAKAGAGCADVAGVVSAPGPPTGGARPTRPRTAAAAGNFRISIRFSFAPARKALASIAPGRC